MTIREIVYVDDPRLRQKANYIRAFTPELHTLAQDMLETMRHHEGVGLAGPQIGVMTRIFVAEIPRPPDGETEPHPQSGVSYVLINPEIIKIAQNLVEGKEGCLSIPKWAGLVERPAWVAVRARGLDGQTLHLKVDDLLARIFMHEIDHLNGVLYTDYITDPDKLWPVEEDEEDV